MSGLQQAGVVLMVLLFLLLAPLAFFLSGVAFNLADAFDPEGQEDCDEF